MDLRTLVGIARGAKTIPDDQDRDWYHQRLDEATRLLAIGLLLGAIEMAITLALLVTLLVVLL